MAGFSGIPSPQFALRKVPATGPTFPSYAKLQAKTIKNVNSNTMTSVAPPTTGTNPYTGNAYNLQVPSNLASGFCIQGSPIYNRYYGAFGAMIGLNLTGHKANYIGNEGYVFQFTNAIETNLWKRVTNPFPDDVAITGAASGNCYSIPSASYTGSGSSPEYGEYIPDYFGKGTSGDHTRSHQVACAGGTVGYGLIFYPKTGSQLGSDGGASSYGLMPHTFDCGVETGTPSYDTTKVWWRRGNSDAAIHAFGGGCWYESDINCVGYLLPDSSSGQMSQMQLFDLATNDWRTPNLNFSQTINLGADTAVEYIAQRKFVLTIHKTTAIGPYLIDRSVTSGSIPINRIPGWPAPVVASGTGWQVAGANNIMKFCPIDGNFYVLVTLGVSDVVGAQAAPQFWRFTPPVNMLTASYATIIASSGGTWTNITSQLGGDALVRGASSGPNMWGPYNGLCWSDSLKCFMWCGAANAPVQLINPMDAQNF